MIRAARPKGTVRQSRAALRLVQVNCASWHRVYLGGVTLHHTGGARPPVAAPWPQSSATPRPEFQQRAGDPKHAPLAVLAAAGRHGLRGVPLRYDATLWSIIFPLGMYAVAGIHRGDADRLPVVSAISAGWRWLAFAAWALVLVLVAMARQVVVTVFLAPRAALADVS